MIDQILFAMNLMDEVRSFNDKSEARGGRHLIQVVGVSGFIGRNVWAALEEAGDPAIGSSRNLILVGNMPLEEKRRNEHLMDKRYGEVFVPDGVAGLVFCAGKAHGHPHENESKDAFISVNAVLALRYAEAAKTAGVERFIYLSSIGVHGDGGFEHCREDYPYNPPNEYARSKVIAEQLLWECLKGSVTELVIIRPPMVYGPDAPGNFANLVALTQKKLPLPLGSLNNRRSFLFVGNLVDFILRCLDHPDAGNQTFVLSDDDDVSTSDFIRKVALAQGIQPWLIPVPAWALQSMLSVIGRGQAGRKLLAPLTVDCSHAKNRLQWSPPYSLEDGLRISLNRR